MADEAQLNAASARDSDQQRRDNFNIAEKINRDCGVNELEDDKSLNEAPSNYSSAYQSSNLDSVKAYGALSQDSSIHS